jgi:hypothetical protein
MTITTSGTNITFNDSTTQSTAVTTPSAVGQIPIANSSNKYTMATLTAGTGITITNASGSITIKLT